MRVVGYSIRWGLVDDHIIRVGHILMDFKNGTPNGVGNKVTCRRDFSPDDT